jgi:hypothetical protein
MTTVDFRTAPTRYHQQDESDLCGEAVAQMILRSRGVVDLDQCALRKQLNKNADGTTPIELCGLLNRNLPDAERGFAVYPDTSPQDGMRRLFAALAQLPIDAPKPAVPAYVIDQKHWVAVTGVAFDAPADLQTAEILGFFVHDPEPQIPTPKVPAGGHPGPLPHSDDDTCGLLVPNHGSIYGSSSTFVTTFEWLHYYWQDDDKLGTFVTVVRDHEHRPLIGSVAPIPPVSMPGPVHFDAKKISDAANDGVTRFDLASAGSPLGSVLTGAQAHPEDVVSVDRIPKNSAAVGSAERYHLAQFRRNGQVVAIARIGADDTCFLSLRAAPSPIPARHELHDFASYAIEQFRSNDFMIDERVLRDRTFTVHPTLVWRPSLQSMSPFYPFVQINFAGTTVFASLDGRIHRALDDHPDPGCRSDIVPSR